MATTPKRARRKRVPLPELDAALSTTTTTTTNPTQENTVSTSTESTPKGAGYTWPKDPSAVLAEYLRERTSADADAPNQRVPFVTGGVLRVHPSNWVEYLVGAGMPAPKKDALAVLDR